MKPVKKNSLAWPDAFIAAGIAPDHCADVLAGSYDVPLELVAPVILDLGANIGAFARWAKARWPGAVVHCYEPHPGNFALLKKTLSTLPRGDSFAYNCAVLDRLTKLPLRLAFTNCGAHSFFQTGEVTRKEISVKVIPARALPKADILKIDTEGSEWAILSDLAGAGRLGEFSAIVLEYHSDKAYPRIIELLTRAGFTLTNHKRLWTDRGEAKFVRRDLCAAKPKPTASLPKIYIATPSHDHKFHAGYALSIIRLQQALAGQCKLFFSKVGGAGVARARNNQAHEFLTATDCDFFFAIDSDISFTPENFSRIVAHAIHRELKNINGLYPLKDKTLRWCVNTIPGEKMDGKTGLQKVFSAGTGFKCIHRSAFERQIAAHPEIAYFDDLVEARGVLRWDFFSMGVIGPGSFESRLHAIERLVNSKRPLKSGTLRRRLKRMLAKKHGPGRYLTEDWYFDHRHRALGGEVYVDCTFHVQHEGMITFPIQDAFAK